MYSVSFFIQFHSSFTVILYSVFILKKCVYTNFKNMTIIHNALYQIVLILFVIFNAATNICNGLSTMFIVDKKKKDKPVTFSFQVSFQIIYKLREGLKKSPSIRFAQVHPVLLFLSVPKYPLSTQVCPLSKSTQCLPK